MLLVTFIGLLALISGLFGTPLNHLKAFKRDFCDGRNDGNYSIPDVFKYIHCKGGVSNTMSCQDNFIFSPGVSCCVNISTQSPKTFCEDRQNGDYTDPWNCHKFFKCNEGYSYLFDCQLSNLVFNPYTDQCMYENEYPCHQVSGLLGTPVNNPKVIENDFCDGKRDGNYPISDVFSYIFCKGGVSNIMSCQDNFIFLPVVSLCVNISTQSPNTFCQGRENGDYNNPWNCHKFFKCFQHYSYLFDCPTTNPVFNPYTDQCVYKNEYPCHQLSVRADDPCNGKVDGNYPLPDIFNYLSCTGGKGLINSCPDRAIFEPSLQNCRDISTVTTSNFCLLRPDGDYMNPWNCQRYLQCIDGATRDYPCLINEFVFNPELDVCVLPAKYPCKQISSTVLSNLNRVNTFSGKSDEILMENPCAGKADGNYLIPDVFAYLQCSSQQGRTLPCPANQIFDPIYSSCRDAGETNFNNFCIGKPDGQYRNPWNCHSFISCSNGVSHNMSCPVSNLVYDPYNNICEYPYQFPCKILNSLCAGKADGKYLIPDVFAYLQCSSQQGGYVNCPDNQIFDPIYNNCRDARDYNLRNLCIGRHIPGRRNKYSNPWNCHSYFTCDSFLQEVACLKREFVYDPYDDYCEDPSIFPCRTVKIGNPCAGKVDGKYLIPNAFAFLQCLSQQGSYVHCANNQIFDPNYNNCMDAKDYNLENFCFNKPDGYYRNPWKCGSYISCFSQENLRKSNVKFCHSNEVYNPYIDYCEDSSFFPCRTVNINNPCKQACKNCLIPDVFAFLNCSSEQGSYENCPDNQIFDPKYSDCKDAKDYNLNNFCTNKPDGQYRNPWNCHTFISCSNGISHNMSCATPVLVYDPYDNLCEYPSLFPCRTVNMKTNIDVKIGDICTTLSDGNYATRNVFQILKCKNHKSSMVDCPTGEIYIPGDESCSKNVNLDNFCKNRAEGNWQNPWDCHTFLTCHGQQTTVRNCSAPSVVLNYDPVTDVCEYPYQVDCVQIKTRPYEEVFVENVVV